MRRRFSPVLPKLERHPDRQPTIRPSTAESNKRRASQHRNEVKLALLSVDDRLKQLNSSNEQSLKTNSTIRSRERVQRIFSKKDSKSAVGPDGSREEIGAALDDWLQQSTRREEEFMGIESEMRRLQPEMESCGLTDTNALLHGLHDKMEDVYNRILTPVRDLGVQHAAAALTDTQALPLQTTAPLSVQRTAAVQRTESSLGSPEYGDDDDDLQLDLSDQLGELATRCADLEHDNTRLAATVECQKRVELVLRHQVRGARTVLMVLQQQLNQVGTGDLHAHGAHRDTIERMLAALPFLDCGKIVTASVDVQVDMSPATHSVSVQSSPIGSGFGQLLLCQWRRQRKQAAVQRLVWWWRSQTELDWMLSSALSKIRRQKYVDPDTKRKLDQLTADLAQAKQQAKLYQDELTAVKADRANDASGGGGSVESSELVKKLRSDLKAVTGKSRLLETQVELVDSELIELKASSSTERIELKQELAARTGELEAVRSESDQFKLTAESEIAALQARVAAANGLAKVKAQETAEFLQNMKGRLGEKVKELEAKVDRMNVTNQELKHAAKGWEGKNKKARMRCDELALELTELRAAEETKGAELEQLMEQLSTVEDRYSEELRSAKAAIQGLQATVAELNRSAATSERLLAEETALSATFKQAVEGLTLEREQQSAAASMAGMQLDGLRAKERMQLSTTAASQVALLAAKQFVHATERRMVLAACVQQLKLNSGRCSRSWRAVAAHVPVLSKLSVMQFVLSRWYHLPEALCVSVWRRRVIQWRLMTKQGVEANWRAAFERARQTIDVLKAEQEVCKLRSATLTSVLCSQSSDSSVDTTELIKVIQWQQASVTALSEKTTQLESVYLEQKAQLVMHIFTLVGLRLALCGIKIWRAQATSETQTTCGAVGMLRHLLRSPPHQQLSASIGEHRKWCAREADAHRASSAAQQQQRAAVVLRQSAEASAAAATEAGVECIAVCGVLQKRVSETQISISKRDEQCADLLRQLEQMRSELEEAQRRPPDAQPSHSSSAAPELDDGMLEHIRLLKSRAEQATAELNDALQKVATLEAALSSFTGGDTGSAFTRLKDELDAARKQLSESKLTQSTVAPPAASSESSGQSSGKSMFDSLLDAGGNKGQSGTAGDTAESTALTREAARIMGHSITRIMGVSKKVIIRVWQARAAAATEYLEALEVQQLKSGVAGGTAPENSHNTGYHLRVKGIRMLLQFFRRIYTALLQRFFGCWSSVASESRNAETLKQIKSMHSEGVLELQRKLSDAGDELSNAAAEENAAAVLKLQQLHDQLAQQHLTTKMSMLGAVLRKWEAWKVTKLLRDWSQGARFAANSETSVISRRASSYLSLLTMQTVDKTRWVQTARWLALQWWALDVVSEKQARKVTAEAKKGRLLEAKFDAVVDAHSTALQQATTLKDIAAKLELDYDATVDANEALETESKKLRRELQKAKRQLQKPIPVAEPSAGIMQQLMKLHNIVIKQYTTFRCAIELGKLHGQRQPAGGNKSGLSYNDTQFDRAKAASTALQIVTEDAAMVELSTRGFRMFAAEVEAARSYSSRRSPIQKVRPRPQSVAVRDTVAAALNSSPTRDDNEMTVVVSRPAAPVGQSSQRPRTAAESANREPSVSLLGPAAMCSDTATATAAAPTQQQRDLVGGLDNSPQQPAALPHVPGEHEPATDLASWIMDAADMHTVNGQLTMSELQSFLPFHPFTTWFSKRRVNLLRVDADGNGAISLDELRHACSMFQQEDNNERLRASEGSAPNRALDPRSAQRMACRPVTAPEMALDPKGVERLAGSKLEPWGTDMAELSSRQQLAGGGLSNGVIGSRALSSAAVRSPLSAQVRQPHTSTATPPLGRSRSFLGVGDFNGLTPTQVLINKKKEAEEHAMNKLEAWATATPPSVELLGVLGSLVDLGPVGSRSASAAQQRRRSSTLKPP